MDLTGKQIDRYRILEQLGQGGMAVVYKAYDTRLERDVAVKVIRTGEFPESQRERLMQRFEREAKAQARFNHPNIVQVHDYGKYEEAPYLVMTMFSGGTLKSRTGNPMSLSDAAALLAPIASALAYAHERKILHRDVKPSNILIDEHGTPFLTDFGIAKLLEAEEGYTLTGTGLGVGTPEYMAPEQWKGQAGPATDIYALGVMLYELVTGRKPYTADTPAAVAIMQAMEPLPLPRQFASDLPDAAEKVILKALALKPEDRYESMAAFGKALAGMSAPVSVPPPPMKVTAPARRPAPNPDPEPVTRDEMTTDPGLRREPARKAALPAWLSVVGGIGLVAVVALLLSQAGPQAVVVVQPTVAATQSLQPTVETSTAGIINFGDVASGSVTDSEGDSWTFSGRSGELVGVMMTSDQLDAYLQLYGPSGELVGYSDDRSDSTDSYLMLQLPTTGSFTIVANSYQGEGRGDYSLALEGPLEIKSFVNTGVELTFGRLSITDDCQVGSQTSQVSQLEAIEDPWFYYASNITSANNGTGLQVMLFGPQGEILYDFVQLLENENSSCFWERLDVDVLSYGVGTYIFQVMSVDWQPLFRSTISVTPSDLSLVTWPDRPPFGEFSFGIDGLSTSTCQVAEKVLSVSIEDLLDDSYFYVASPYQFAEVGTEFTWSITSSTGAVIYGPVFRQISLNRNLCWWQGFSMEGEGPGDFIFTIDAADGSNLYWVEFQIASNDS